MKELQELLRLYDAPTPTPRPQGPVPVLDMAPCVFRYAGSTPDSREQHHHTWWLHSTECADIGAQVQHTDTDGALFVVDAGLRALALRLTPSGVAYTRWREENRKDHGLPARQRRAPLVLCETCSPLGERTAEFAATLRTLGNMTHRPEDADAQLAQLRHDIETAVRSAGRR